MRPTCPPGPCRSSGSSVSAPARRPWQPCSHSSRWRSASGGVSCARRGACAGARSSTRACGAGRRRASCSSTTTATTVWASRGLLDLSQRRRRRLPARRAHSPAVRRAVGRLPAHACAACFGYQELLELWPLDEQTAARVRRRAGSTCSTCATGARAAHAAAALLRPRQGTRADGVRPLTAPPTARCTSPSTSPSPATGRPASGGAATTARRGSWRSSSSRTDAPHPRRARATRTTARCGSAPATATSTASWDGRPTAASTLRVGRARRADPPHLRVRRASTTSSLWSTDADFEQNHVVRWHRATGEVTVDGELPDVTYYAIARRRRARPARARAGRRAGLGRAPRRARRAVARLAGHRRAAEARPVAGRAPGAR